MDAWCKLVNTRYINGFLSQKVYYVAKSIHQLTPLNRITRTLLSAERKN